MRARARAARWCTALLLLPALAGAARADESAHASPGRAEATAPLRTAAWVGLATTVALAAAGGVFALAARARSDQVSALLRDAGAQPQAYDASTENALTTLRSEGHTYQDCAAGLLAAAGAVAVVSAGLAVADVVRRRHREGPAPALAVAPAVAPGQAHVSLRLKF